MRDDPPPSRPAPAASVEVTRSVSSGPSAGAVASWAGRILEHALTSRTRSRPPALSILLCGDVRMRTLNRRFRGVDRPTDVLSFPAAETGFLGDLAIDVPYARRAARRLGHSLEREVEVLLVHGILHLLGHDHEVDGGKMFRLQRRLVPEVFGPGPDGVPEDDGGLK